MTTLTPDLSLGQLVVEHPGLARVLDRLGLDYCCGGRATLAEACAAKGLDVDEVVRELASDGAAGSRPDRPTEPAVAPLTWLADQIVTIHHAYLNRELPRLDGLIDKVVDAHADRHPELRELRRVFTGIKNELESHMFKEEEVLFPIIKQLEAAKAMPRLRCGGINDPILVLEHEHASVGSALQRMRDLTSGYLPPNDACPTYRALLHGLADLEIDLHRHIHKENNVLFPRAGALESALKGG